MSNNRHTAVGVHSKRVAVAFFSGMALGLQSLVCFCFCCHRPLRSLQLWVEATPVQVQCSCPRCLFWHFQHSASKDESSPTLGQTTYNEKNMNERNFFPSIYPDQTWYCLPGGCQFFPPPVLASFPPPPRTKRGHISYRPFCPTFWRPRHHSRLGFSSRLPPAYIIPWSSPSPLKAETHCVRMEKNYRTDQLNGVTLRDYPSLASYKTCTQDDLQASCLLLLFCASPHSTYLL